MFGPYGFGLGLGDPLGFGLGQAHRPSSFEQQAQANAQAEIVRRLHAEQLRRSQQYRSEPPKPRSRFDTPDVIDLVPDADGVFRVPAQLEHRARER